MPGIEQLARHGLAHVADAKIPDTHVSSLTADRNATRSARLPALPARLGVQVFLEQFALVICPCNCRNTVDQTQPWSHDQVRRPGETPMPRRHQPSFTRASTVRHLTAWLSALAVTTIGVCVAAQAQPLDLKPLPKGETQTVKIGVGGIADTTHIAIWYAKY